jgi:4-amino-4-deoxy-L-arabinose transferase-like glycosyltransferase
VVLLAIAIVPYFIDLGGSAIWDANEAFYVETPREMIERGDYVTPMFNYEPRLNKPVLSYWIVAGFYHLYGISVGVQRVPIALAALVLILTAYFLARAAADADRPEAALWAALGLAVTPRLLMFARRIFIDVYISMFFGLTLLCFALAERYPARRRTCLVLMYVAAGLGVLTKGPVAIALPVLAFGLYLLVHGELRRLRSMMLPLGAAIVAAIVAPWYVALYLRHGWAPLGEFIFGENVARYTAGIGYVDSVRGPFFYLPVLIGDSFPVSMFLVMAAAGSWRKWRAGEAMAPPQRIRTLLLLWIVAFVVFFSASAAKQDLYIFPIVPAVAALAGVMVAGATAGLRWTALTIGVVVAVAGAGVLHLFGPGASVYALRGALAMGIAALAGGLIVSVYAAANRIRASLLVVVLTFITMDWVFVVRVLPDFERFKPVPGFAQTLSRRLQPDDALITYDEALPSLVFYLRRHVDPYFLREEVFDRFRSGHTVYAILSNENYVEIGPQIGVPTCVIERRPTFDVKLRNMWNRDLLPELVLITNKCGDKSQAPNPKLQPLPISKSQIQIPNPK